MKTFYKNLFGGCTLLILFLVSCNTQEFKDLKPSHKDKNWYSITPGEGVINEKTYALYQKYGIAIYTTDSLGREQVGVDESGNPIWRVERINLSYRPNSKPVSDSKIVLSKDEDLLLKAIQKLETYVLPNVPQGLSEYRPTSYLLVDTLYYSISNNNWRSWSVYNGVRTVAAGQLQELETLNSEDEWKWWAARILSARFPQWVKLNCPEEYDAYYNLLDRSYMQQLFYKAYILVRHYTTYENVTDTPYKCGFLRYECTYDYYYTGGVSRFGRTPSIDEDIQQFFTAVYFYTNNDAEFIKEYVNGGRDVRILKSKDFNQTFIANNPYALKANPVAGGQPIPILVDENGEVNADESKNQYKIGFFDYWYKPNSVISQKYELMKVMVKKYEEAFGITRTNF